MKIIDCFIFYNELELLKIRLNELWESVDYFVLVEGTLTFTGNNKRLYYNDNKHLFEKYNNKIIHIIVDDYPTTTNPWIREYHQRNCISRGIKMIDNLDDSDVILISDVDEIPNSRIFDNITISNNVIYALETTLYYYNLEWTTDRKWAASKLLNYLTYKTNPVPEKIRHMSHVTIPHAGWHLSYYGDINFIINKLESFSEQQANIPAIKDEIFLKKCIAEGILCFSDEKLIHKPHENNTDLPRCLLKNNI